MLIFWKQKLVFLATPKAGSSAIEAALEPLADVAIQRPAELKHTSAQDFQGHLAPYLAQRSGETFTTVALMRQPIDWLRSWYRFRLRDDDEDPGHPMIGRKFEQFAQDYMASSRPAHVSFPSQSEFLCDGTGTCVVDTVFRYDQIDSFVHFLEDQLDFAITLPRVNVPPAVDVTLSERTQTALTQAMARDFTLYDSLG
ncbi:sulfotransferase family 2 domain-containing protein [Thioclava sp.]|uniref:sulfotransferase family 2 domain-containing protein n=1 Tax=Thioclava sp. TaxID=1933450 RepID=UPI003AA86F1D